MTITEARTKLGDLQTKLAAYGHALSLLFYDGATGAPKGSAANRARTMTVLSEEHYKLVTAPETMDLLDLLEANSAELDEKEARIVELMQKDLQQLKKIPMDEYLACQELMATAEDVWRDAKEKSDFAAFEPTLVRIFDTYKRFAGYVSPEKKPYDHWLNEYEEGISMESCDAFFKTLKERIVPLVAAVQEKPQVDDSLIHGHFPAWKQEKLAYWLMDLIRLDRDHVGLSTTEHPFTTSLGSHFDERITTHYHEDNVVSSMFSVIHEGGHALYDTHSAADLAWTELDGGVSMGIHESQSRFYENILGRSRALSEVIFPKLAELFPEEMAGHTAEEFYRAINRVEPSLIRIEADEVTYALHIMVRYELEKAVFAGDLAVHDLPAMWNRYYKEYLGVDVPDDRRGVLQDSHWAGGNIGYFPSYALGSAYGAHFLKKMKETVDVEGALRSGDLSPINAWNEEHIWRHGSLYKPSVLLERVLGEPFSPEHYVRYLEEKCKDVYGL